MANPLNPQPGNDALLNEMLGGQDTASLGTQIGGSDPLLDELTGPLPGTPSPSSPSLKKPPKPGGESNTLFGSGKAETVIGEFGAGLQSGARQVLSTVPTITALGASYIDPEMAQGIMEWSKELAEGGAQRGIGRLEDLTLNPMTWARYVAGVTGEAVPFIAAVMTGAGGAALLTNLLRRKGVSMAQQAMIKSTMPAFAGAFATAGGIETAATAQELHDVDKQIRPVPSVMAGAAKGALESFFPLLLARQYGMSMAQGSDLYGRMLGYLADKGSSRLGNVAVGMATEGATELAQEEVDIITRNYFDENFAALGPEGWSRRLNAAVAGAVGGGVFSSFHGTNPQTALLEKDIRDAVGETPIMFGADAGEMPSAGPEHIIRTLSSGLDATAGLASGELLNQSLAEVDLRSRGLYGAIVPGRDITFGTQEQANNDYDFYQGSGFAKLDPTQVTRGDITASIEDVPDTLADPRVDFLVPETMQAASDTLTKAIATKQRAAAATGMMREKLLDQAANIYRQAVQLGARVEPLVDGQVIFRDQAKAQQLMQPVNTVEPQVSTASLLSTMKRGQGKDDFYVMATGSPVNRKRPGGRALDMENVDPNDVTAFPDRTLARSVLADHAVARDLNLSRAKAKGIRFLDTAQNPQALLQELVNVLNSMPQSKAFHKAPAEVVERFMSLVDQGLRLDVATDTAEFAVLRRVRESELVNKVRDEAGPEIVQDANTSRIVKQRAQRDRTARVTPSIGFQNSDVEALFYSQMHNTGLQNLITGPLEIAANKDLKAGKSPYSQTRGASRIIRFVRGMMNELGIKSDFYIEVVGPGALDGKGVRYYEDSRPLTLGGKPHPRSIIQIDPWKYARPTTGGKELRQNLSRAANYFVQRPAPGRAGGAHMIAPATPEHLRKIGMSEHKFVTEYPGATHFSAFEPVRVKKGLPEGTPGQLGGRWTFQQASTYDDLVAGLQKDIDAGIVAQTGSLSTPENVDFINAKEGQEVTPTPYERPLSVAGKIAAKFGVPETKYFSGDQETGQFYTDFTRAMGEIIVKYEWSSIPQGLKDAITIAYSREQNASKSLTRAATLARTYAHPVLQRTIGERGRKGELYNFEEWLVQHISRAMIDPNSKIGPVQEFFDKLARQIKKMFETTMAWVKGAKEDRAQGRTAQEVMEWLAFLQTRGQGNAVEPFLSEATRKSALDSIAKNQAALAGWNMEHVVATPERASTLQVRKLLDLIPDVDTADRKKLEALLAVGDRFNTVMEWGLGINQLSELNEHIEPLRRYVSLNRAMEDDALSWASMADNRLRQVQSLPKNQQRSLWSLMDSLDRMTYLDQKLLKDGKVKPRWPTAEELVNLVRSFKLSSEAFEAYRQIRQDYLSFLTQLEITGLRNAEETISDPVLLDKKKKEISGEIAQMRSRPYFPHMRFGKYIVTVKGNNGQVQYFAAFDTEGERTKALPQIQKTYKVPQGASIVTDTMSPSLQSYQGLPRFALEEVKKALGLDAETLTAEQKKERDTLEALALDAAPINSFRHNLGDRDGTPGYSMDGLRAYATYFARSARFVARMEYSYRLQESIKDVRRTGSPIQKDTRTRIADYMQQHYDAEMNPTTDWATARAVTFLWYFAYVPMAAFVNLSQVPMVTYPYLASKFPGVKRGLSGSAIQTINQNVRELSDWLKGKKVAADDAKMEALDQAHSERLIDDGFHQELAAVSQGSVLSRTLAEGKVARTFRTFAQWGVAPFSIAERFNRSVTFRTAFDLALANPENVYVKESLVKNESEAARLRIDRGWPDRQIAAYIFAAEAVRTTQFEYSRWARPKIFQGGRAVFFMFKSYMQNMMYFMFKQNRGTQVRMMLMLFAVAGLMGAPGAEDGNELAKALAKLFGYHIDPELFIRRVLKDFAGDAHIADILLHGASRVGFGVPAALQSLGIPSATPDLSGSLGMGKLIPGLAKGLQAEDSAGFNEILGDVAGEVAGPILGVPFSMLNSIIDKTLPADDPKRWERAMPRAMRNVSKSSRYLAEQRERDRTGATIYQFDPNDISDQMDALSVGLGFTPANVSRQWDAIEAQRQVQGYWTGQRKLLMNAYARAHRLADVPGKQDARTAIREFNEEVPYSKLKITQDSISKSLKARERERKAKETRVPTSKMLRGPAREIQALFPEAPTPQSRQREIARGQAGPREVDRRSR